jgi:CheY-like chemotaxis protein
VVDVARDGERLLLRVTDEGQGIEPQDLATVFSSFQSERTSGGLGLGLAIARRIIDLHGGAIALRSLGTGRGTECEIELLAATSEAVAPSAELEAPASSSPCKRLLLVEDNDDAARALRAALQQLGYEVALAHDGPIALNLAKTFRPDVALLDLGLPVMDGWELAARLRNVAEHLPIVAVTARDAAADKQRSAQTGFAEHLVKPIDLRHLVKVVESLPSSSNGKVPHDH